MVEVYTSSFIEYSLTTEDLAFIVRVFKRYKAGGDEIYLGKDVPYHYPQRCIDDALQHVHVYDGRNTWLLFRSSDRHVVYTQGFYNSDHYYLIALLEPDAHKQANDTMQMLYFCDVAEIFRLSH